MKQINISKDISLSDEDEMILNGDEVDDYNDQEEEDDDDEEFEDFLFHPKVSTRSKK